MAEIPMVLPGNTSYTMPALVMTPAGGIQPPAISSFLVPPMQMALPSTQTTCPWPQQLDMGAFASDQWTSHKWTTHHGTSCGAKFHGANTGRANCFHGINGCRTSVEPISCYS